MATPPSSGKRRSPRKAKATPRKRKSVSNICSEKSSYLEIKSASAVASSSGLPASSSSAITYCPGRTAPHLPIAVYACWFAETAMPTNPLEAILEKRNTMLSLKQNSPSIDSNFGNNANEIAGDRTEWEHTTGNSPSSNLSKKKPNWWQRILNGSSFEV